MLALVRPGEEDLHATDVGGMSNASAIGVRGLCGRGACRVRRPPDPAQARGGRAGPWLVPASLSSRPQPGAWQIVAGRIRPHEKHITRTACAPGARCGASAARPTRRAADLRFRSARNARLAPACPDGRFDRMMTLFLRWRTSRTGRSGRRERALRPVAPPGPARRRAGPRAFSLQFVFYYSRHANLPTRSRFLKSPRARARQPRRAGSRHAAQAVCD